MTLTINQTIRNRLKKKKSNKSTKNVFGSSPQKKGVCIEIKTPKKPNSAKRKVCKVKLSNNYVVTAYIPGEKHNVQEHSYVLLKRDTRYSRS